MLRTKHPREQGRSDPIAPRAEPNARAPAYRTRPSRKKERRSDPNRATSPQGRKREGLIQSARDVTTNKADPDEWRTKVRPQHARPSRKKEGLTPTTADAPTASVQTASQCYERKHPREQGRSDPIAPTPTLARPPSERAPQGRKREGLIQKARATSPQTIRTNGRTKV